MFGHSAGGRAFNCGSHFRPVPRAVVLALLLLAGAAPPVHCRWNLLYFSVSDNSLECDQLQNLRDVANSMQDIPASEAPNIFVYMDRAEGSCDGQDGSSVLHSSWTNAKDMIINAGGTVTTVRDYPEPNQATSQQLASFIQRAVATFPADNQTEPRYMLLMNDHGGAWAGLGEDDNDATGSISFLSPAFLNVSALSKGIAAGLQAAGLSRLDILGFDACLMANYEVAMQLAPLARYLLASPMTEPGTGWDQGALAQALRPNASSVQVGHAVVDTYVRYQWCAATAGSSGGVCTLSFLDMEVFTSELVPAMASVSEALLLASLQAPQAVLDTITAVVATAGRIDDDDNVGLDLQSVLQLLASLSPGAHSALQDVSTAAADAARALTAAVEYFDRNSRAATNVNALSVYLPGNGDQAVTSGAAIALAGWNLTSSPGIQQWLEFISNIYKTGNVTYAEVAAAAWAAPVAYSQQPQEFFYTAFAIRAELPASVATAVSTGQLHFGFVDQYAPDSYIVAGSQGLNGTAFAAASSNISNQEKPRTVQGTFNGMFVGLRQQLDADAGSYVALSMAHVRGSQAVYDTSNQQIGTTISMSVMYASSCIAPGSTYIDATLYYTWYQGGRSSERRLFTLGNAGVFGGPGSNSTLQAEVLPGRGGVIITYLKRFTLNGDGTARQTITFDYTDCFKWAEEKSLEFVYDHVALWSLNIEFEDIAKTFAMLPSVTTAAGETAFFQPFTMGTPLINEAAGLNHTVPPTTLNNCTCVVGWGDMDGTIYTDKCGDTYDPGNESNDPNGTWCPVVPHTCKNRTFDYCSHNNASTTLPNGTVLASDNGCLQAIQAACEGLVVETGGTGGVSYVLNATEEEGCPEALQMTGACFMEVAQRLTSKAQAGACRGNVFASLLSGLLRRASDACEGVDASLGGYVAPTYLLMRRVISAQYNTGAMCPGLADYATWYGYTEPSGIISAGGFPEYEPSSTCHWIIEAPPATPQITLVPLQFDTEPLYDVLYVYDGTGLRASFSGRGLAAFPTNLTTSTGFLRLLFVSDDTVNGTGFQLQYTLSASMNSKPACGTGQAVLTAVTDVYGYGSDVSWALAQGTVLDSGPAVAPVPADFSVLAFGGNAPRGDTRAVRAILPSYPALLSLYANSVEAIQYFCVPLPAPTSFWTLYMFSPATGGWGGSTLDLYLGSNFSLASHQTLPGRVTFNTTTVVVPETSIVVSPTLPYTPPAQPKQSLNFSLSYAVSNIESTPPTLVRFYSRLGITSTLQLVLRWVVANRMDYNLTAQELTIAFTVSGLSNRTQAATQVRTYVAEGTLAAFIQGQLTAYRSSYDTSATLQAYVQSGL